MEHLRTSYYCVAGHYFRLTMPENEPAWLRMSQYHPFEAGPCEEGQLIFSPGSRYRESVASTLNPMIIHI